MTSPRRRLLFVSNLFPDEGEPYRGLDNATLLHHLKGQWDIRVVSPRPMLRAWRGGKAELRPRAVDEVFRPVHLAVRYVPKLGDRWNHRLMLADLKHGMKRVGETGEWDLLLASWLFPDGWAATRIAKSLGRPAVMIAQGSDVHRYLHRPARRRAILVAASDSRAIITRSRSLADLLGQAGVKPARLHPVHNGVEVGTFHHGSQREAREALGLPLEGKWILFVGNLLPVKNPHLLIEAFHKLRQRWAGEPVSLALAGKGPLRPELEARVAEAGLGTAVRFLGPQDAGQVAQWMRAADVLAMSSHNEGLPNVVLEAMASGLPVVATQVGGIHEIVDAAWKGRLVPPGDEEALAQSLGAVLTEGLSRERIGTYGAGLSWMATADACHRILCDALDQ